jgi:hypothetical protein
MPVFTSGTRVLVRAGLRSVVSVACLVGLYYTVPLKGFGDASTIGHLVVRVLILLVLMAWQVKSIMDSRDPAIRAVETLSVSLPLFILIVATSYVLMSQANVGAFSESLSRTDGLYFAIMVFSTVGFGDIIPISQSARIAVMLQIVINLLLLGVGLRIVVGAVNVGRRRQPQS